jgi:hypothetical protein
MPTPKSLVSHAAVGCATAVAASIATHLIIQVFDPTKPATVPE